MTTYRARFDFARFDGNYAVGKITVDRNYRFDPSAPDPETIDQGLNKIIVSGTTLLGAKNYVAIRNNVKYITNPADKDKVDDVNSVNMALFCIEHTVRIPIVKDPQGNVFIACYAPLVGVTRYDSGSWVSVGAERLFDSITAGMNVDSTAADKKHVIVLYDGESGVLGDGAGMNAALEAARAAGFTAKQQAAEVANGQVAPSLARSIMGPAWPFKIGTGAELKAYESLVNAAHATALASNPSDGEACLIPAPVEFIEGVNEQVVRAGTSATTMTR